MISNKFKKPLRVLDSLWILFSLIIFYSGIGFVYIGYKTSNKTWVRKGICYELPWILVLLSLEGVIFYKWPIFIFIALFVFAVLTMVVSFARAVATNSDYAEILDKYSYRKSISKPVSFLFVLISSIPFVNGLSFIYFGAKTSKKRLVVEGFIYEFSWVFRPIYKSLNPTLHLILGFIAMSLVVVSLIRSIKINYTNDNLSYAVNSSNDSCNGVESTTDSSKSKIDDDLDDNQKSKSRIFKFRNRKHKNQKNKPYESYNLLIVNLKKEFDVKEEKVSTLIEEQFLSSKITYNKFMAVIANAHENFYYHADSALDIIDLALEPSQVLEDEIVKKINILKSLITKMNDLSVELILNKNNVDDYEQDLNHLVNDFEDLIDSVKDYN